MQIFIIRRCNSLAFSFSFSLAFSRKIHVNPQFNTCSSVPKPPDSFLQWTRKWLLYEHAWIEEERKRRGSLLISLNRQQCCTYSLAIYSPPTPSKLSQNPRNLTMSCRHVPKHGREKRVSSLEPCHFVYVQALLLVSYLLNPLIVI